MSRLSEDFYPNHFFGSYLTIMDFNRDGLFLHFEKDNDFITIQTNGPISFSVPQSCGTNEKFRYGFALPLRKNPAILSIINQPVVDVVVGDNRQVLKLVFSNRYSLSFRAAEKEELFEMQLSADPAEYYSM